MKRVRVAYVGMAVANAGALLFLFFFAPSITRAPHVAANQEPIIYPVQYSDTHITENAKATDPKLENLASFNATRFIAGVAGSLPTNVSTSATSAPERGTWLWTPTLQITPAYRDSVIAGAKANNINAIYLSIDSYLDIFVMPDGSAKEQKEKAFDDTVEQFITAAHKAGIAVDAEAGWRNWAEPGNEYKASAVVDYVLQFNATHAEKFRGFQYDIEPYLLASYPNNKADILRHFVSLIDDTVTKLGKSSVQLSVVIPDFYDGTNDATPRFFYNWTYTYALNHLLDMLARRPGSTLIVMAYRNESGGSDGSIAIASNEVHEADATHTKVIVAQETGDVTPAFVTFYDTSHAYLNEQIGDIRNAFASDPSFNGIAIHYINSLLALK